MFNLIVLFVTLIISLPALVSAQTDSVNTGVKVIEDFYTGMNTMMRDVDGGRLKGFQEQSVEATNKAASSVRSVRWIETPGKRRYDRIYGLVSSYMDDRINAIKEAAPELPAEEQGRMEKVVAKLGELKKEKLRELQASLQTETFSTDKKKPVPLIDSSPYEKDHNDGTGIWFR